MQDLPHETSGWAFMEEYNRRHDTSFVKDFAEDIDTMLVFVSSLLGISDTALHIPQSSTMERRIFKELSWA